MAMAVLGLGKEAAGPGVRRDPHRRTWPASPPQLRRGVGRAMAAKPGDEQA
jgi:hypothetical protein